MPGEGRARLIRVAENTRTIKQIRVGVPRPPGLSLRRTS
ncbi:hypothetical protein PSMK_00440 [Phycisphaera mikurensis NBRC 102666]|uniref:Uncharacterized protein n=1 Tax=Phycisphaera mikurensis (strain NBRC 102666 / KCTC 22515 / FYK2301M01) TaxID=1142394 RepID=I0IAB5_PHYMF|nr:hypothetical protein PSMK_00440 [Phycisphaera mikurensis NBRC 102666]